MSIQIFICGDSTAASYSPEKTRMAGWGQVLGEYLPEARVINLAMAGRSTRTFLEENRLEPVEQAARPGDLVLIQFAHNDENEKKPERYAAPWTTYRENLMKFVRCAREKGAVPVFLTPICMRIWENGTLQPTHGEYPAAMRSAAAAMQVPLIDLYTESFRIVEAMGEEGSKALFMHTAPGEEPAHPEGQEDNAHTRRAGAERFAAYAARQLRITGLMPPGREEEARNRKQERGNGTMGKETEKNRNLPVAYIGGGSRGWAWGFMKDLAADPDLCGTIRLYDIDRAAAERNQAIGQKISAHPDAVSRWKYEVSDSLKDALQGTDFVVISILPGTFDEMESDVHLPERAGVWQPVGDTVGAGGFMRAMRTIPMFVTIAEAIRDYAPEAWVINYTNPMSLCVRTLYEVFPKVRAFGCCHEVFGTQKLLCAMLKSEYGIEGVKRQDLHTTVTGINHFTWITEASWNGTDLMPLYAAFADQYAEEGYWESRDDNWMNSFFNCAHRVKFDLFRRYGAIAAAGDRHLAEFTAPWYTRDPETVKAWKFGLTPVSWRKEDLKRRLQRSDDLISGKEAVDLTPSGEEGHLLIKALLGLGDLISNVNVPNRGQIPNLPLGAVVETNAAFGLNRIDPVCAGPIPSAILPLVARHVYNQENTLQTALRCDRKLGFTTFMNDPQMAFVTPEDGQKLFDEMLENQRTYLPAAWFR